MLRPVLHRDREAVAVAARIGRDAAHKRDGGIAQGVLARLLKERGGFDPVARNKRVHGVRGRVARLTRVDEQDLPAAAPEHERSAPAGRPAAYDDGMKEWIGHRPEQMLPAAREQQRAFPALWRVGWRTVQAGEAA